MICATQCGGGDVIWRLMHGSTRRRAVGCKPGGDDGGWQSEAGVRDCDIGIKKMMAVSRIIMLAYYKNGGMYI